MSLLAIALAALFVSVVFAKCPIGTIQGVSDSDCYVYRSKPELWFQADEDCMRRGGHLASVSGRLVNSFISQISDHYCASEYWLGAGWNTEADDAWVWTDGRPFRYTNWAPGEPSTTTDGTFCVAQDAQTGLWHSRPCRNANAYVCRIPPLALSPSRTTTTTSTTTTAALQCPTCPACPEEPTTFPPEIPTTTTTPYYGRSTSTPAPPEWHTSPVTGKCYSLVTSDVTLADTEDICEGYSATLASVHSDEENQWLSSVAQMTLGPDDYIQIGLHRRDDDRTWRWFDGTSVDFTNWASGQPAADGGNFVQLLASDGEWYPSRITETHRAICQKSSC